MSEGWFITGANRGLGLVFAEAALQRGDKVVAGNRKIETLDGLKQNYSDRLLPLALGVTNRNAVFEAVNAAAARCGCLNAVVNNASYGP